MADFGWISGMTWLIQSLRPFQWMRKFLLVLYCYLTIHLALIQQLLYSDEIDVQSNQEKVLSQCCSAQRTCPTQYSLLLCPSSAFLPRATKPYRGRNGSRKQKDRL